ncbi:Ig-like domain-containing protein, partial [Bacteroidota bacterium]
NAGGTVTVMAVASDSDGDNLTYSWIPTGGAISGTGPAVTWTSPSTAGAYSITVTVTDGNGGTASSSATLTVTAVSASTNITGTASFIAGVNGDLSNSKISIYTSLANWNSNSPIRFTASVGSGSSVTFVMNNVLPGNYYLDVWKDCDNSAGWSLGDFVGWHGSGGLGSPFLTEFQITEGNSMNFDIDMFIF